MIYFLMTKPLIILFLLYLMAIRELPFITGMVGAIWGQSIKKVDHFPLS